MMDWSAQRSQDVEEAELEQRPWDVQWTRDNTINMKCIVGWGDCIKAQRRSYEGRFVRYTRYKQANACIWTSNPETNGDGRLHHGNLI